MQTTQQNQNNLMETANKLVQDQQHMSAEIHEVKEDVTKVKVTTTANRAEAAAERAHAGVGDLQQRVTQLEERAPREQGHPPPAHGDLPRHMRTTLVIGNSRRESKRGDLLAWATSAWEMRPQLPKPVDMWAPHRKGSQIQCKCATVNHLNVMATVRTERWQCQGNTPWANIERTEAEAAAQRPLNRTQWPLRASFPLAAPWAIERSSKKLYGDDNEMGEMRSDWLVLNAPGLAALRRTQADLDRLMAEQSA